MGQVLWVLCIGWEVKNDMSGQSKYAIRVYNVKIRKSVFSTNGAHFWEFVGQWLVAWSDLNYFFQNGEIRWKRISRHQIKWFLVIWWSYQYMFNMFVWFHHSLLISEDNSYPILIWHHSSQSLWHMQEYEVFLQLGDQFLYTFLDAHLVATLAHILVEEVVTFKVRGLTLKDSTSETSKVWDELKI